MSARITSAFDYSFQNICNKQYGRITVIKFSHEPVPYRRFWVCLCRCGKERTLRECYIKSETVTCAICRRHEIAARTGPRYCPSCKQNLPRSAFRKSTVRADGLYGHCIACCRSKAAIRNARRLRRRPEDIRIPPSKQCSECRLVKPAEEFWTSRIELDGLARKCSECSNAKCRQWYVKSGRSLRLPKARTARYGMTPSDLATMLEQQGRQCAICAKQFSGPRSFHIDHDHTTGKVRGLLCPACNNGIGAFHDSAKKMEAAIHYLTHHRSQNAEAC